jgi:hypothetical protein
MTTPPQPAGESDRIAVWEDSRVIGYVSSGDVNGVTRWHSWRDLTDTVGYGAHQDQEQAERHLRALAGSGAAGTEAASPAKSAKKPVKRFGQRGV